MKSVLPENLDIQAARTVEMPVNNKKQNMAIEKALTQTFTVIQGPPGIHIISLLTCCYYVLLFCV